MVLSDLALSKRLERAEGHACVQYAEARRRLFPSSGTEWIEHAGAYAMFDGPHSPVTQSFGLGIFQPLSAESLDRIERFFFDRGASADHEVSPLAGAAALSFCATATTDRSRLAMFSINPSSNSRPKTSAISGCA
jgi:hypothetical protein